MRRKIGLLLVIFIVFTIFTGCSPKKTEEERKAEIREELEKEEMSEELKAELKKELENKEKQEKSTEEDTKAVNNTLDEESESILKGKLILTGTELGHGILLDEKRNINGNMVNQIYFNNKEDVLKFVPRRYFTFYFEGRTSLKEELSGKIPIEVEADFDSFNFESDRNIGWIDVIDVISVNDEKDPADKSMQEYPDEYYKDVFNVMISFLRDEVREPDIRDMEIYKSGGEFKEAVDKLIERGYFIEMGEGDYYINKTKQNYTDGEVSSGNNSSYYEPENITIGQNIGGLKVSNIDYEKGERLILELKGSLSTKGVITGYYNEMYGENEFIFTPSKTIDKPIKYSFDSGFQESINKFVGSCNVDALFDLQTKNFILEGNELKVNTTITDFRLANQDETSGGKNLTISNVEIIPDEYYIGYIEGVNGKKPKLENEIFTTTNQGDFYVDYDDYRCVVIPMHDTINSGKAETVSVDFGGNNTQEFKFTVFGEIQDVKINYVTNMGEEGNWKDLGKISNSIVKINASLPNDMSSVIIYGRYHEGEGFYKDIKFSLDDMRDLTAYDIILFK